MFVSTYFRCSFSKSPANSTISPQATALLPSVCIIKMTFNVAEMLSSEAENKHEKLSLQLFNVNQKSWTDLLASWNLFKWKLRLLIDFIYGALRSLKILILILYLNKILSFSNHHFMYVPLFKYYKAVILKKYTPIAKNIDRSWSIMTSRWWRSFK